MMSCSWCVTVRSPAVGMWCVRICVLVSLTDISGRDVPSSLSLRGWLLFFKVRNTLCVFDRVFYCSFFSPSMKYWLAVSPLAYVDWCELAFLTCCACDWTWHVLRWRWWRCKQRLSFECLSRFILRLSKTIRDPNRDCFTVCGVCHSVNAIFMLPLAAVFIWY